MDLDGIKTTELVVFTILFVAVSALGFVASRWRRAESLESLDEWGLGGRSFGAWITWFLIGGDLYTAYTFVAVPALVFGAGAIGFFAVPYTIVVYPIVFFVLARMWSVSHANGFVTPADFVRARSGSPTLALLVALTGIVATMPYIALQLVGIEAVLKAMGVTGHLPIIVAFTILAAYTYNSGLRAPALIAFVKDTLIYLVVITAIIVIPYKLGGFDVIFAAAEEKFAASPNPGDGVILGGPAQLQYATLALGSALALFLYPHSLTGIFAARSRGTVMKNMAALPAYSFILGLLALLGYMAIAAGVTPLVGDNGKPDGNTIVPLLFEQQFPSWFAGIAFAAIGIGALVPAATNRALHPLVPREGPHRRLGGRHGGRLLGAVPDPAARVRPRRRGDHRQGALRRLGLPAGRARLRHSRDDLRRCARHRGEPARLRPRYLALRGRVDDGIDTTHPTDYTAEAGDPGVRDLTDALH
jgi:SSS family solute:Na+ symporter